MANVFVGNRVKVDEAVLAAVRDLGDDYWVFVEFDINRRNIDWLIVRAIPESRPIGHFSTVILTELKRTLAVLEGGDYGRWRELRDGDWTEIEPSNLRDENYWQQLINTANDLRAWLHTNQRRFLSSPVPLPEPAFKVWPNLLILGPSGAAHRLPLAPQNRYGAYHFDLDGWIRKVRAWAPTQGLQMTASELDELARVLGLQSLPRERPAAPPMHEPEPGAEPNPEAELAQRWDAPTGVPFWVQGLAEWAQEVEDRLRRLEERSSRAGAGAAPKSWPREFKRALGESERRLIAEGLEQVVRENRRRDFQNLFAVLAYRVGAPLKTSEFFGFGSAMDLMDQARREEILQFGPPAADGHPTVYLPSESVPIHDRVDA